MTKQQAITAMKEGLKVRHPFFKQGEWIKMEGDIIITEDDDRSNQAIFFGYRDDWETDWDIVN
jgi:hypothetical protein